MKILVTGAAGQLGYDVCRELLKRNIEHKGLGRSDLDICDKAAVKDYLNAYAPDAVIHCAAYTAVDKAEEEAEQCLAVNAGGTQNLAEVCRQLDCKLLYISTDYVFDGQGSASYTVNDKPAPINVYGQSKLDGELIIQRLLQKHFIVRTSWMFGLHGKNFVKSILRLAAEKSEISVVDDQLGSPTYTVDLAKLLVDMIQTEKYGIYHAVNAGICSRAEFAEEILKQIGRAVKVKRVKTQDYVSKAERPLNSRMSQAGLIEAGFALLPGWTEALHRYLREAGRIFD